MRTPPASSGIWITDLSVLIQMACYLAQKNFKLIIFKNAVNLKQTPHAVAGNVLLAHCVAEKNRTVCCIIIFRTMLSGTFFFCLILNKSQEFLMQFWRIFRGTELLASWICGQALSSLKTSELNNAGLREIGGNAPGFSSPVCDVTETLNHR